MKASKQVFIFLACLTLSFSGFCQADATNDEVELNEIFVIGNKKTRVNIILRELSVTKGSTYDLSELEITLDQDRERIYNTNLFNEVSIQVLEGNNKTVDLLVTVHERWYFYPAPLLEIADRNLMDWLINRGGAFNRFNFGLRMDQFNFRGKNERIRFLGQIGFERRFMLSYSIPYIEDSQRHGLSFDIAFNERENMPYITEDHLPSYIKDDKINRQTWGGLITYSYRPSFYNFHYAAIGYRDGTISDTIATLNPNYYGNGATRQKNFRASYSYISDYRNKRAFPTSGHYFSVFVEKMGLGIYDDVNILSLVTTINKYQDLGNGWYLSNGFTGRLSFPKKQAYFNYLDNGLGYYGVFARGFELNAIEGQHYILQKNTIKRKFFSTEKDMSSVMPIKQFSKFKLALYAKAFADFAWVNNYENYEISSRLTNRLLYSVGLGIDMVTMYDLVLRFEYSYNSEDDLNFALNIKTDI